MLPKDPFIKGLVPHPVAPGGGRMKWDFIMGGFYVISGVQSKGTMEFHACCFSPVILSSFALARMDPMDPKQWGQQMIN